MSFVLFLQLVSCVGFVGATTTYCGEFEVFCLGKEIFFQCNTTNPFLEWYLPRYNYELDFSGSDYVGDYEIRHGLAANLTGKKKGNLMSTLVLMLDLEYNNSNVICVDGFTGQNQKCTIVIGGKAGYPNHVIKHKLNETSLDLSWNPPSFTGGAGVPVDHYNLTVSPPPSIDPCRTGYCIVKSTNITFHGLKKCSSFDITITPINCNGLGSLLKLPVISKVPARVLNLSKNEDEPISLHWAMPMDNGGENISYYRVCNTADGVCWKTDNHSYAFENMTNGEYNFSVRAVNCHGPGDPVFISVTVSSNPASLIVWIVTGSAATVGLAVVIVLLIVCAVFIYRKRRNNYSDISFNSLDNEAFVHVYAL